jgi:beta-galactosidase
MFLVGITTKTMAREVYNVGAGWTFFTSGEASTDNVPVINLPHIQTSEGTVNYMKNIDIPLTWEGRRVFLRVSGVARVADIFVDGIHTATHRGGNSDFTVEITDRLVWGTPASVRIVVNNASNFEVLPTAGSEKIYGGISRGVELIVCDPLSVSPAATLDGNAEGDTQGGDGMWITTDRLTKDRAEGNVRLALLTPPSMPIGAVARVRFADADGNVVAQNSVPVTSSSLTIPFTLSDPHLWQGVEDPYLYNVDVALMTPDGLKTDSLSVETGFRTVGIDSDNNFTLNGKPLRIHGVILHRDRITVGTALTPFQIEEDVDFVLEMGANAVRVVGGQHDDYFYSLCNRAGLVVWNDNSFTGAAYPTDIDFTNTEAFRENGRQQMGEMISALYNHPSVVMWGIYSNVSTRTGNPDTYIGELNNFVHGLDQGRLTAASSVRDGDINRLTDIVLFDLSLGWESGLPDEVVAWLGQLRSGWPDLRTGISYSAGASIFDQSELMERPSPTGSFHPEGWQTFFHEEYLRYAVDAPGLWGVFVGNMFDSGAAKSYSGALAASPTASTTGAINDRGLVTFDRKDRKDAFWLYKANWNRSEPFVHIVGSRLETRVDRRQTIRVYSNLPEVELFAGGRSQGRRTGERGIFVWEDVNLRPGINRLEARATGSISDSAQAGSVTVNDRASLNITSSAITPSTRPEVSSTGSGTPPINAIVPEQTAPRRTVNPR